MSNPIDEQIERLRAAVLSFYQAYGRVPTVAYDADGVIYEFEQPYITFHNRCNPDLPAVVGPFERFDVGYNQPEAVQKALQVSMDELDWSELKPYPEALAVIPVLVEVGLDLSIATSHRVTNTYSPAAKVYQFHRDFQGYFDDRIQIGLDKTRVVADFLVDDKPEVKGKLAPMWEHIRFTQNYNRDLPGIHVVWETMFEVLASAIEAKVAGRTLTPVPADTGAQSVIDEDTETVQPIDVVNVDADEVDVAPVWATGEDTPLSPVDETETALPVDMPWTDDDLAPLPRPVVDAGWDDAEKEGDEK